MARNPATALSDGLDRQFDRLVEWACGIEPARGLRLSLAMLAMIGAGDYLSGPAYSFAAFYYLPLCLAAWTVGRSAGVMIAVLGVVLGAMLNSPLLQVTARPFLPSAFVWNFVSRIVVVTAVATIVSAFRRVFGMVQARASTDDLTGALTKRAFGERLRRVLAAPRTSAPVLVFGYCDLDGFKGINDRHGHAVGDRVLAAFAASAVNAMRPRDILARVGGDEFVMLMLMETPAHGMRAAERVHRHLSRAMAELPTPVTVSMGAVVVSNATADDEAAFLAAADALMYEVKRSGKDALRIAAVDLNEAETERMPAEMMVPA